MIKWFKTNFLHILFTLSLAALVALGAWWAVFINRAVSKSHDFHLSNLRLSQRFLALYYDCEPSAPPAGRSSIDARFFIEECQPKEGGWVMPLKKWEGRCLRPDPQVLEGIEAKYRRQVTMVLGEGALLFLLVGVGVFMLWRSHRTEKRLARELERFVEALTHRLKGPSSGLRALLETLRMKKVKEEEMKELVDLGLIELERQRQIVDNILVACRQREDPWKLNLKEVALATVVEDVVGRWRRMVPIGDAIIEADVKEDERVFADENALRIVLENIVDNAFKYSKSDGVKINISVVPHGTGMLKLIVEDAGMGIRREDLERIFEPLWSCDRSKRGSGLGLYISRRILRMMGGDLFVTSEGEGKGSCVAILLRRSPHAGFTHLTYGSHR